jgi:hypothetical protein
MQDTLFLDICPIKEIIKSTDVGFELAQHA